MSEYYDSRNRMKDLQNAAAEQHPFTTIAGNIAPALLTAGASAVTTGTQAPSAISAIANNPIVKTILPSTKNMADASRMAKIGTGIVEGAKAGALTGFGSGDSHLMGEDGSIGDVIRETADSTVGGGLIGGAIPAAVGAVKGVVNTPAKLINNLPITDQIKTAFKGGQAGINLDEKSASDEIRNLSTDIIDQVQKTLSENGFNKNSAFEYADEIGVRVNAGETLQEAVDNLMKGAMNKQDKVEKDLLLNAIKEVMEGPANKAAQKLETARAKMIQKMGAKGYDLLDETKMNDYVQDLVPESQLENKVLGTKQTFQKIAEEGADGLDEAAQKTVSKPVERITQQVQPEEGVPMLKYDANSLKLGELEKLVNNFKQYSRFGDNNPIKLKDNQSIAGGLSAELRRLSDDALEKAGTTENVNQSTHQTLRALRKIGADDNVFARPGSEDYINNVDKVWSMVKGGDDIKPYRFFEALKKADPENYAPLADKAEFMNKFSDLARQVKPLGTSSTGANQVVAQMGGVRGATVTAANKLGQTGIAKGVTSLANLTKLPAESLSQLSNKLAQSQNKVAREYAAPLLKAAQSSDQKRSAILYGLYQQPAFRELYQSLGEETNDMLPFVNNDENQN
jgi:hypothetical protein